MFLFNFIDNMFWWESIFFQMISSLSHHWFQVKFNTSIIDITSIDFKTDSFFFKSNYVKNFVININNFLPIIPVNSSKFTRFLFQMQTISFSWKVKIVRKLFWNWLNRRTLSNCRQCQTRIGCLRQNRIVCTNF